MTSLYKYRHKPIANQHANKHTTNTNTVIVTKNQNTNFTLYGLLSYPKITKHQPIHGSASTTLLTKPKNEI
jgi:hypothetical protein